MSKKMAKKKENDKISVMAGIAGTCIYIPAMLVIYPAFYRTNLLNLITDKKNFFVIFSAIYLILLIPGIIERIITCVKEPKKQKMRTDGIFLGILLLAVGMSTLFSIDRSASLSGLSYRTVAADVFVLCIAGYLGVRAYAKYDRLVIWSLLIGSAIIYIFGILCGCGINFLHMQDELRLPEIFLTPLGNTNFNASYVCLVLPVVLVMYMISKEQFSKRIYAVVMYLGFLFSVFIKTESSLITILASLFLLFFFALEKEEWSAQYIRIWGIYILANATVSVIWHICKDQVYPFEGICAVLLKGRVILIEAVIYAGLVFLWRWKGEQIQKILLHIRMQLVFVTLFFLLSGAVVLLIVNVAFRSEVENSMLSILLFNDKSLSNRGILWRNTVRLFQNSNPVQILFGHGLNCYGESIRPICYDEIVAEFGFLIKDPHNELLQVLSDMGILGMAGYYGLLITTLISACSKWKKNELSIVVILTVSSYLLQGMVNCYALTHLPILFILLGLFNGDLKQ